MSEEKKPAVTPEMADVEFARWIDAMGLDPCEDEMTKDERRAFAKQKRRIVGGLISGSVTVDDQGQMSVHTSGGKRVTFPEPVGVDFMAMDGKGEDQEVHKQFAVMASMTKTDPVMFSKMKNRDLNICLAITAIFLL